MGADGAGVAGMVDRIEEPAGDVMVRDGDGDVWVKRDGGWVCLSVTNRVGLRWDVVLRFPPLTVYEAVRDL